MSSRRRHAGGPAQAGPSPETTAHPASSAPGFPAGAEDDLHRRAVELREYRMGRGSRPAGLETPVAVVTSDDTVSLTFPVQGMTCRACEVRIAKHVGRLPGVARVSASAVHGRVTVECTEAVSTRAIEGAIGKAGYQVGHSPWVARRAVRAHRRGLSTFSTLRACQGLGIRAERKIFFSSLERRRARPHPRTPRP